MGVFQVGDLRGKGGEHRAHTRTPPPPRPSAPGGGKRRQTPPRRGDSCSEGTGLPPTRPPPTTQREVKAGEAGPGPVPGGGKGGNTFLLPPELFPLVAGVHGGVAGGGFELQVPQAHEGVDETPRQSRPLPTPRAAACCCRSRSPPASAQRPPPGSARRPSAGSRLALTRHPRSARPPPRSPLAPADAAQQPPPPPAAAAAAGPGPARVPAGRGLSAVAGRTAALGWGEWGGRRGGQVWRVLGCDSGRSARRWRRRGQRRARCPREAGAGRSTPLSAPGPVPPATNAPRPASSVGAGQSALCFRVAGRYRVRRRLAGRAGAVAKRRRRGPAGARPAGRGRARRGPAEPAPPGRALPPRSVSRPSPAARGGRRRRSGTGSAAGPGASVRGGKRLPRSV